MKRLLQILIFFLFLLVSCLAASSLTITDNVIMQVQNTSINYTFYETHNLTKLIIDKENLSVDNLTFSIHTDKPVHLRIVDYIYPYQIINITDDEKFLSTADTTFISPSYGIYYITKLPEQSSINIPGFYPKACNQYRCLTIFIITLLITLTILLLTSKDSDIEIEE